MGDTEDQNEDPVQYLIDKGLWTQGAPEEYQQSHLTEKEEKLRRALLGLDGTWLGVAEARIPLKESPNALDLEAARRLEIYTLLEREKTFPQTC